MFDRFHDQRKKTRGQAVVEFALVLPILLLLLLGISEFGRAFLTLNSLTQAAREGARIAATGGDQTAVNDRVMEVLNAANITPAGGGITFIGPDMTVPDRIVTVTVTSDFQVLGGSILPFSGIIPLTGSTVMRFEG